MKIVKAVTGVLAVHYSFLLVATKYGLLYVTHDADYGCTPKGNNSTGPSFSLLFLIHSLQDDSLACFMKEEYVGCSRYVLFLDN